METATQQFVEALFLLFAYKYSFIAAWWKIDTRFPCANQLPFFLSYFPIIKKRKKEAPVLSHHFLIICESWSYGKSIVLLCLHCETHISPWSFPSGGFSMYIWCLISLLLLPKILFSYAMRSSPPFITKDPYRHSFV